MMDNDLLIRSVIKFMVIFGCFFIVTMASFMNGGLLIAWTLFLLLIITISAAGIIASTKKINILPTLGPLFFALFSIYEGAFGLLPEFPLDTILMMIFFASFAAYLFLVQRGVEFR